MLHPLCFKVSYCLLENKIRWSVFENVWPLNTVVYLVKSFKESRLLLYLISRRDSLGVNATVMQICACMCVHM